MHNLEVQDVLLDVATFWLERGVKGLRLDAANYYMHDPLLRDNPTLSKNVVSPAVNSYFQQHHLYDKSRPENLSFLRKLRKLLDRYPDAMAVAEIGDDEPLVRTAEYIQPDVVHTAYNFCFLTDHFSPDYLSSTIKQFEVASPKGWPSWTFSNHDASRVLSRWGAYNPSPEQAKVFLALLLTLRGTVFLYQGEELGLPQAALAFEDLQDPCGIKFWPEDWGRDGCRTPMVWTSDNKNGGFSTGPSITLLSIFLPVGSDFRIISAHGVEWEAMAAKYGALQSIHDPVGRAART